ncbi:MAG: HAD-IA family hydrolase [Alphaproteobacteria bacterium]
MRAATPRAKARLSAEERHDDAAGKESIARHWTKGMTATTLSETLHPIKPASDHLMDQTSSLRLAIFDCDGTLVDGQYAILAAMRAAWRAEHIPDPDPDKVRRVVGLPLVTAIETLLPDASAALHRALSVHYVEAFQRLRMAPDYREPLFPGAVEALERMASEGFVLGIATGKSRRGLLATLGRHGLERRFATFQTSDEGPGKPDPRMVNLAMADIGAEPAGTVMIGDTVFDMEMAQNANVIAVGVSWGYHGGHELRAAGAVAVADTFDDLPRIIADVMNRQQGGADAD